MSQQLDSSPITVIVNYFYSKMLVFLILKQVELKNFATDIGRICLKTQRQKKYQLLDLSPNQLEDLIKITNNLVPTGFDLQFCFNNSP